MEPELLPDDQDQMLGDRGLRAGADARQVMGSADEQGR